jgi:hypothetical protein
LKVLFDQGLVEGVKRALGVGRKGGNGVDQGFFISTLPLETPCVSTSLT